MTTVTVQFPLERGERLLWSGRPRQGIVFAPADVALIPFTLLWAGFAVFWELNALRMDAPFFFPVVGALFVAVGLHFVFGRFVVDARRRATTDYAITTERIIIRSGILSPTTTSLSLASLSDLALTEQRNGYGAISFGATDPFTAMLGGAAWPGVRRAPRLESLIDARQVYSIILDAQKSQAGQINCLDSAGSRASDDYSR